MFRALVIVNAIVGLAFGVALLLVPGFLLSMYDLAGGDVTLLLARLMGAEFLGYNLLSLLLLPKLADHVVRRGLTTARAFSEGSGFVVTLLGRLAGIGNALVWSVVALYLIFALAYLFFLVRPPQTQQR